MWGQIEGDRVRGLHVHLVFPGRDPATGKRVKWERKDLQEMQSMEWYRGRDEGKVISSKGLTTGNTEHGRMVDKCMAQKDERLAGLAMLIDERGVQPLIDEGTLYFNLFGKSGKDLAQPAMVLMANGRSTTWRLSKMVAGLVPGAAPVLRAISAIEGVGDAIAKITKSKKKKGMGPKSDEHAPSNTEPPPKPEKQPVEPMKHEEIKAASIVAGGAADLVAVGARHAAEEENQSEGEKKFKRDIATGAAVAGTVVQATVALSPFAIMGGGEAKNEVPASACTLPNAHPTRTIRTCSWVVPAHPGSPTRHTFDTAVVVSPKTKVRPIGHPPDQKSESGRANAMTHF